MLHLLHNAYNQGKPYRDTKMLLLWVEFLLNNLRRSPNIFDRV